MQTKNISYSISVDGQAYLVEIFVYNVKERILCFAYIRLYEKIFKEYLRNNEKKFD